MQKIFSHQKEINFIFTELFIILSAGYSILSIMNNSVKNLCIYLPIFSVFNTICYSFMVHSFHRAALILLPVSQNCYRYLKNAVQYFFAEIYIVMVLICFHLVNFHTYETFPISDLSQDFWYININFIFTEIQNTM